MTFVFGESWCAEPEDECGTNYKVLWAREFRYDSARARYMNAKLNTADLTPATGGTVWSDYAGDDAYADFTVSGTTQTNVNAFEPGQWRKMDAAASYLHSDLLGTLRKTTGATGSEADSDTFTAFGERVAGTADRHGFAGAWGYQSTVDSATGQEVFPYQHLGARYYDPASGRFLQRDPIGVRGGENVYGYALNRPTAWVDPRGLDGGSGMGPLFPRTYPAPAKIAEEVRDAAANKGDDWAHYVASCRITRESALGTLLVPVLGIGKEIVDQLDLGPSRPPVSDSLADLWADALGYAHGLLDLLGLTPAMTCELGADIQKAVGGF